MTATRWLGHCPRCERSDVEVESRESHAMKVLCDRCASVPHHKPAATGLDDSSASSTAARDRTPSPASAVPWTAQRSSSTPQPTPRRSGGEGSRLVWAEGEPFMLAGPEGVGKTTLAQQLLFRRAGIGRDGLLGLTVAPDLER
jgi:hypothetical protein